MNAKENLAKAFAHAEESMAFALSVLPSCETANVVIDTRIAAQTLQEIGEYRTSVGSSADLRTMLAKCRSQVSAAMQSCGYNLYVAHRSHGPASLECAGHLDKVNAMLWLMESVISSSETESSD